MMPKKKYLVIAINLLIKAQSLDQITDSRENVACLHSLLKFEGAEEERSQHLRLALSPNKIKTVCSL